MNEKLKVTGMSSVCFVLLCEYCQEAFFFVISPPRGTYLMIASLVMYQIYIKRTVLLKSLAASPLAVLAR